MMLEDRLSYLMYRNQRVFIDLVVQVQEVSLL
jgi:hypothetical protein